VGAVPSLPSSGTLHVTAEPVPALPPADPRTLEQQIWAVADYVTGIIQQDLWSGPNFNQKETRQNAN
jgi:hypothetical protein